MPSLNDWRPYDYEIPNTYLDVQIHDDHVLVESKLEIKRKVGVAERSIFLNGSELDEEGFGLALVEVTLDGAKLDNNEFTCDDSGLTIHDVPDEAELRVTQRITIPDRAVDGLYRSGQTLITQCEDEAFRQIAYYPDRPDVLSKWTVRIEADKSQYPVLLSNGNEIESGDVSVTRHSKTFLDPYAKPCYLFALAAGKLASLEGSIETASQKSIALAIYSDAASIRYCKWAMDCLKRAIEWDESVYERVYDLDRFAIVAVEKFVFGAMENKSLNVFNNLVLLADPNIATDETYERIEAVVGHEYFHNYSGNRVTVRDWFQLSLKEGFTVLRDQMFSRSMNGFNFKRILDAQLLRCEQFPEAQCGLAHPVRPVEMEVPANYYTRTIYEGGAEIAYMLSNMLGAESWKKAASFYFDQNDGKAVMIEDFIAAIAMSSNRDLAQFKRWYTTIGTPVLDIVETREGDTVTLSITQSGADDSDRDTSAVLEIPLGVGIVGPSGQDLLGETADSNAQDAANASSTLSYSNPKGNGTLVFQVDRREAQIKFENVLNGSHISVLRDFSAPIEVRYTANADDLGEIGRLEHLALHDSNSFARYDAIEQLWIGATIDFDSYFDALASAVAARLNNLISDKYSLEECRIAAIELSKPREGRILDLHKGTPIEKILSGLQRVQHELGDRYATLWQEIYTSFEVNEPYEPSTSQKASRQLRALALSYLHAKIKEDEELNEFVSQMASKFAVADNLTDRLTYFKLLLRVDGLDEIKERVAAEFYDRFKNESLVVERWINALVSAPTLDAQDRIAKIEAMGLLQNATPNRWRAVFHSFSENWENFHLADGSGYRFYTDRLIQDAPEHASVVRRAIQQLAYFNRHDTGRRDQLRQCLLRLQEELPSSNVPALDMVKRALQDS